MTCEFSRQSVPMETLLRSSQRTFPERSWGTFAINVTPHPRGNHSADLSSLISLARLWTLERLCGIFWLDILSRFGWTRFAFPRVPAPVGIRR